MRGHAFGSERPIATIASGICGQQISGFVIAAVGFSVRVVLAVVITDPKNVGPRHPETDQGLCRHRCRMSISITVNDKH